MLHKNTSILSDFNVGRKVDTVTGDFSYVTFFIDP